MDKYGYLWPFRFSQAALMVTNRYIWTGMDSCFGKGPWARRIECHLWRVSFCFFSLSFVRQIREKGVRSGSPATTTYVGLGLNIVMSKIHYCCFQKGP